MTKKSLIYKQLSELLPYVSNSRTHSEAQVTQIADSITEFGFTNPILIDESNGVIAGHGRILAAKKLNSTNYMPGQLNGRSEKSLYYR